jgi:hypothetical protein
MVRTTVRSQVSGTHDVVNLLVPDISIDTPHHVMGAQPLVTATTGVSSGSSVRWPLTPFQSDLAGTYWE